MELGRAYRIVFAALAAAAAAVLFATYGTVLPGAPFAPVARAPSTRRSQRTRARSTLRSRLATA